MKAIKGIGWLLVVPMFVAVSIGLWLTLHLVLTDTPALLAVGLPLWGIIALATTVLSERYLS